MDKYERLEQGNEIEIYPEPRPDVLAEAEGFPVMTLMDIRLEKLRYGREKDLAAVKRIDAFLKGNHSL